MVANGAALDKRDYKTCTDFVDDPNHTWSALAEMKYTKTWIKRYAEYAAQHDSKGQYIRFAAETNHPGGFRHLAFSNHLIRKWEKHQNQAVYRYTVKYGNGGKRMYTLRAGERCLDNGAKVGFDPSTITNFYVDVRND